jgi:methylase of polypeptide subunit release factors
LQIFKSDTNVPVRVLEVGCGVGNTTIPLLEANPKLFIFSCDFSTKAIETLKSDTRISPECCHPFVWDITESEETGKVMKAFN